MTTSYCMQAFTWLMHISLGTDRPCRTTKGLFQLYIQRFMTFLCARIPNTSNQWEAHFCCHFLILNQQLLKYILGSHSYSPTGTNRNLQPSVSINDRDLHQLQDPMSRGKNFRQVRIGHQNVIKGSFFYLAKSNGFWWNNIDDATATSSNTTY